MENQVPEEIKHKRFNRLKALVEEQTENNSEKYVGTKQKILVEGISKSNDEMLTGRTETNKVVVFDGERNLIGKVIEVQIVRNAIWYLQGEVNTHNLLKIE